ncbi:MULTISPECIES: hypothetical protein [unclassified Streptomyces]|uniref:hypothetical protein n=1 Tax=unclassified Streptomyces TaxID=2593676 RepID=UPI00367F1E98
MQATDQAFDAIRSVFGTVGLVAPELLLAALDHTWADERTAPGPTDAAGTAQPPHRPPAGPSRGST